MNSDYDDKTICALATTPGGAVAIIRISGKDALPCALHFWHSEGKGTLSAKNPRRLILGTVHDDDGNTLDASCLAVYMPGPNSYTGEDVVELQLHGGALCAKLVLGALQKFSGVRLASPGEFTRRAFLNGKMDLTAAEAVADILKSESEHALRLANRQLQGELRHAIDGLYDENEAILAEIEARVDFPEEDIDWSETQRLAERMQALRTRLLELSSTVREGEVLRSGVTLVIAGEPNVGKSSLLNRLLGRERAIVSDIPGTTRDTIEAELVLRGIPFHLIDTAGMHPSADVIEQSGIERARVEAAQADIVLWLADASLPAGETLQGAFPSGLPGTVINVINKCDLTPGAKYPPGAIAISARTGAGLEKLADAMEQAALGGKLSSGETLAVSSRHAALLVTAANELERCHESLAANQWELLSIPLKNVRQALGEITGKRVSPDLLDTIFHRFCIGK